MANISYLVDLHLVLRLSRGCLLLITKLVNGFENFGEILRVFNPTGGIWPRRVFADASSAALLS